MLEEKFGRKETFSEKQKKRTKKAIEETNDIRRRIEEIEVRIRALEQSREQSIQARQRAEQTAEQEAQARQTAEQTAEQEAQRQLDLKRC